MRAVPGGAAVRVEDVPRSSAAAQAGLTTGDQITAVDGTPVADLTFTRLQELLNRSGATFSLTVRRGGKPLTIALENPPASSP
jgi:S1-C subfamily serine protease